MKKNLLALSVAAALGAGASVAQAAHQNVTKGVEATGNALVVPYYSVQNGNATLINIGNTDSVHGKAVKVRFRGAERSDDVFDFQVFLSPDDMWTASLGQDAEGRAALSTDDVSCTLPANVNQSFVISRLTDPFMHGNGLSFDDPEDALEDAVLNTAMRNAATREGYVEIIVMGDIVDEGANSSSTQPLWRRQQLFDTVLHTDGEAPCNFGILSTVVDGTSAGTNAVTGSEAGSGGRLGTSATGGIFANATIINVTQAAAWSMNAQVVEPDPNGEPYVVRYWPQTNNNYAVGPNNANLAYVTLDNLFLSGDVQPRQYDFPDLSTPGSATDPVAQYKMVNQTIGHFSAVANEYITDPDFFGETDWVMNFPTRRYGLEGRSTPISVSSGTVLEPFSNVIVAGSQSSKWADAYCIESDEVIPFDREERTPDTPTEIVISPGDPVDPTVIRLCGEVAVVSFNGVSALGAQLSLNDLDVPYQDGWAVIAFDDAIPVIANAFVKANASGGATAYNFGGVWKHRGANVSYPYDIEFVPPIEP